MHFQVFKLFYLDGWHDLDKVYYLLRGTNPMKTRMLLPFSVTIEQTPSTKEDRKMHLKTSEKASKWILSKVNFSSFCQIAYFSFQAMLKFINTKFLTALPITLIMSHQTTVYIWGYPLVHAQLDLNICFHYTWRSKVERDHFLFEYVW